MDPQGRIPEHASGVTWSRSGLAAVLDPQDEIAEVTADYIAILKTKRGLLKFRRNAA
jgi:hypothetical protein